ERRFLVLTFLIGVALVGIAYGGPLGNPLGGPAESFLDGAGGAFRTVLKFQPVVMLPLALGLTQGATVALAAVERWKPRRAAYAAGAIAVVGALVLTGASP